jgi:hypothetical protein
MCQEHCVHFGSNPLAGAAKHLAGAPHGGLSKEHTLAVKMLGYRVVDCTAEKMETNNRMVLKALEAGYKPMNLNTLTKSERLSMALHQDSESAPQDSTAEHGDALPSPSQLISDGQASPPLINRSLFLYPQVHHPRPSAGVTRPKSGHLYLAYWAAEKRYYAAIVLPWDRDLRVAGLKGTLGTIGLLKRPPRCVIVDKQRNAISGWAPEYEDGGEKESKREFPIMYFDKEEKR